MPSQDQPPRAFSTAHPEAYRFPFPAFPNGWFPLCFADEVSPGEVLALVGPSGAGKTTLVNLIPRFFDPTAGRILVDGAPLPQVQVESLRRQIGIVPQETLLFGGSVRENILYGKPDASMAE